MFTRPVGQPPFRADHIGSLLRPPALRQAFKDHLTGRIDDEHFAQIQDGCIRDAVKLQEAVGLEVVTDGEFRAARIGAGSSIASSASASNPPFSNSVMIMDTRWSLRPPTPPRKAASRKAARP